MNNIPPTLRSIDRKLNEVHTVLSKILMNCTLRGSPEEFDAIESAEEILNDARNDLASFKHRFGPHSQTNR